MNKSMKRCPVCQGEKQVVVDLFTFAPCPGCDAAGELPADTDLAFRVEVIFNHKTGRSRYRYVMMGRYQVVSRSRSRV